MFDTRRILLSPRIGSIPAEARSRYLLFTSTFSCAQQSMLPCHLLARNPPFHFKSRKKTVVLHSRRAQHIEKSLIYDISRKL